MGAYPQVGHLTLLSGIFPSTALKASPLVQPSPTFLPQIAALALLDFPEKPWALYYWVSEGSAKPAGLGVASLDINSNVDDYYIPSKHHHQLKSC